MPSRKNVALQKKEPMLEVPKHILTILHMNDETQKTEVEKEVPENDTSVDTTEGTQVEGETSTEAVKEEGTEEATPDTEEVKEEGAEEVAPEKEETEAA